MNTNIQRRIITVAAHGYNDCFCIADKTKQVKYVNEYGELRRAHKKDDNYYHRYHLYYEEAKDIVECYKHENGETLSISIQLENAKYNDLYLVVIDVDRPKDANENKLPIDTEAPPFKAAYKDANIVTRSKNGGYHMYFAINKEKSAPLFEEINLLCDTENSYVCKCGQWTADKRIKVDFFCDTFRLIYEPQEWDINKELTDKTQELYELIKKYFPFATAPHKEQHTVRNHHKRQRTHREYTDIAELDEFELTAQMDEKQKSVFLDLMANKSPNCSRTQWYKTGINIYCVFGDELGGEVFYYWSKDYTEFDYSVMRTEWDAIVSKENAELREEKWIDILNGDIETKAPTQEETCGPISGGITFRGKPIKWIHEDAQQENERAKHWIQWGEEKYKRDDFFKAAYGADYKTVTEKVIFNGDLLDNTLWLSTGARTRLEYDLLRQRHKNVLYHSDDIEQADLWAFFASSSYSKSQEIKRRLSNVGLDAIITFGIGREQKGAAQHTWCYTREYIIDDESGDIIGIKFSGVKDNWEDWAANIRAAYEYFMNRITDGELWDNMYKSMYTKRQNKDISYIPVHRMTYTKETLDLVKSWILGGCKDEFPLQGTTPDSDFKFTVMFDTDEVEYIEAAAALKERNTAQKEELAQARSAAKIDKDRAAILAHLSDDKQEFTREDLNNWGFSNNVITRLKKSTIKKVRVKTYVLQDA